jgi:hypothetical protein
MREKDTRYLGKLPQNVEKIAHEWSWRGRLMRDWALDRNWQGIFR